MSGAGLRLRSDAQHLDRLAAASGGELVVREHASAARRRVVLALNLRTAADEAYPQRARESVRLVIDLPQRYPFEPPVARVDAATPVFHPNVFANGVVCIGTRWLPSEGLDLFVTRLARLLAFDPLLVNLGSAANAVAAHWYSRALRAHPAAFPSGRIRWAEAPEPSSPPADAARVLRSCPGCGATLRLPAGREGEVACPRCASVFRAST